MAEATDIRRAEVKPPINVAMTSLVDEVDMLGTCIEKLTDRLGYVLNEDQTASEGNYPSDTPYGNASTMLLEIEQIRSIVRTYKDRIGRVIDRLEV